MIGHQESHPVISKVPLVDLCRSRHNLQWMWKCRTFNQKLRVRDINSSSWISPTPLPLYWMDRLRRWPRILCLPNFALETVFICFRRFVNMCVILYCTCPSAALSTVIDCIAGVGWQCLLVACGSWRLFRRSVLFFPDTAPSVWVVCSSCHCRQAC